MLCVAWEGTIAPTGRGTLVVKALPLVALLPGLWRGRLRAVKATSLVVWLYVGEGLVRATSEPLPGSALAALETALAVLAFAAAARHVRRVQPRAPRRRATPRTPAPRVSTRRSARR